MFIKTAGIFAGLPKPVIDSLLYDRIGEDSPIKPTNKITNGDLAVGKAYFGKLNNQTVAIVKGKKGVEYAIGKSGKWTGFTYYNLNYKKIRSLGELQSVLLAKLQEDKILSPKETLERIDWYVADPINIPSKGRNYNPDREEKQRQQQLKPTIDKKLYKEWAKKQLIIVKNDFNKKSIKAMDDFFGKLLEAMDLQAPQKIYDQGNMSEEEKKKHFEEYYAQSDKVRATYDNAKSILNNFRNTIGYLENVVSSLKDKFSTMWRDDQIVRLEDAKELKKYISDALKEKDRWS